MKWHQLFLMVLVAACTCQEGYGQNIAEIVQRKWVGISAQDANFTSSGKAYLEQELELKITEGNNISGITRTRVTLDTITYTTSSVITGSLNTTTWQLQLFEGDNIKHDILPWGLQWCRGDGTFKISPNGDGASQYILKGTYIDDCGGTADVEYYDH